MAIRSCRSVIDVTRYRSWIASAGLWIIGASFFEISAHTQYDESGGCLVRTVPNGGSCMDSYDECPPLLLIEALGKDLLELVNDQQ